MVGSRDPAIPVVLLDGAQEDADDVSVEIVPRLRALHRRGEPRGSSPGALGSSSGCVDQGLVKGLVHTSSGCSQGP
jgi:hypothetical protein